MLRSCWFAALFLLPVLSPAQTTGIGRVTAFEGSIEVAGSLDTAPAQDVALDIYELAPQQASAEYMTRAPLLTVTVPAGQVSFSGSLPRFDGERDRLYAKFLAIDREGVALGVPHYVDDFQFAAANDYEYPSVPGIKGLQALFMSDDAEDTGTRRSGVNTVASSLMRSPASGMYNAITYHYQGKDYYFDVMGIWRLDQTLRIQTRNGINATLIVYVTPNPDPNSAAGILVHPDADTTKGGPVYAFNTKTAEGIEYLEAFFAFLGERYTRADGMYGRALDFIIGNEINSPWAWSNMGEKPIEEFLEYYTRVLRIAYQALRRSYSNPRVYISLDHCWDVPGEPSQPLRFYKGKDTLDLLAARMKAEGDFNWWVAYHPYAQNGLDPYWWADDTDAIDSPDTPYITYKNPQVLSSYLEQPELLYRGEVRRISFSEESINTPASPLLTTLESERVQAASWAYAYYKFRFLPHLDSFIIIGQEEAANDDFKFGLWTSDAERSMGLAPGRPKYIRDVYKYIDTPLSLQYTQFALPIVGLSSWEEGVPGFDATKLADQPEPVEAGVELFAQAAGKTTLFDFEESVEGWRAADNASAVKVSGSNVYQGSGMLRVTFGPESAGSSETKLWRGADVLLATPFDATAAPYLDFALLIPETEPERFKAGNVFYAKVKVYSADGHVAEGIARMDPSRGWVPVTLDLRAWPYRDSISRIKIWARGTTNDDWNGWFGIDAVGFATGLTPDPNYPNIDAGVSVISPVAVGSQASVTVVNNGTQPLSAAAILEPCANVALEPASLSLAEIPPAGGRQSYGAAVSSFTPGGSGQSSVCVNVGGQKFSQVLEMQQAPPPPATVRWNFNDGTTEGWQPGQNVYAVDAVKSFANGPGVPIERPYALEARCTVTPADQPKSVIYVPPEPLDYSGVTNFVAHVNTYGAMPGLTFSGFVTLYSDGDSVTTTLARFQPNSWNKLSVDISAWPHRDRITKIEIGFRATNSSFIWSARFQIDYVVTNP